MAGREEKLSREARAKEVSFKVTEKQNLTASTQESMKTLT